MMIWEIYCKILKSQKKNNLKRNNAQVNMINSGLKEVITNLSEEEKKSKNQMK